MDFFNSIHSSIFSSNVGYLAIAALSMLACIWFLNRYGTPILSWALNQYLNWKFPTKTADNQASIPTCPYVWPNGQGDVAKFLEGEKNNRRWREKHGDIYRIWSGMKPEIVLSDPADIKAVFADSDKHSKATNNNSGWLMGELLGKCVGLISGTDWLRVRSITAPRFSHKESATYIPRIIEITENHFKELHKGGNLSASELHPVQDLKFLPFWVIADILYGELTSEMVEELKDLIQIREALWARMIQGGMTRFSWTWLRPTKEAEKLQVFKKRWAAFNQSARDACLLSQENAAIVEMYNAAEHGHLSMDELLQTLDEMLFANLDVTIGAISWIPLFLASHVEVQEQLREEIETNTRCGVQEASEYLLSSSTFLSACVLESARLRPLAPFSVPQSAPTARYVGGYVVPAGTDFTIDTYKLNIQNPVWGQDRETYNPARFLGKKGSSLRYHYWRFGFGPRQCMGKYVADLVINILLVHLMKNYRLSLHEKTHWVKNPTMWITHPDTIIRCERI